MYGMYGVCVCMHVCMYICVCMFLYFCMYICVYVFTSQLSHLYRFVNRMVNSDFVSMREVLTLLQPFLSCF